MTKGKKITLLVSGLLLLFVMSFSPMFTPTVQAVDFSFFKGVTTGINSGLVPCGNDTNGIPGTETGIVADSCNFQYALQLVNKLIDFAFWVVSFVLIGVIAYSGFKYIVSLGKPNEIEDSKKRLQAIIKGLIWMLCAWVLVFTIQKYLLNEAFISNLFGALKK